MADRVAAIGGTVAASILISACTAEQQASVPPNPSQSTTSDAPAQAPEAYNPCDALTAREVGQALGTEVALDEGVANAPRCAFGPLEPGGPVLDANYSTFPGGLDPLFDQMRIDPRAVTKVTIPRADAARIVVDNDRTQLFVSGFVQNGELIQTVDVVAPAPYRRPSLVRGVRSILAALSAHANPRPGAS